MGESTASAIAKKLNLPRTSVQDVIDSLHKRGMMNVYAKRRYKFWIAENPDRLLISLKESEAALKSIMPELSALRHEGGGKPTVKVFHGADEIRHIHDDMIATKQHIMSMIAWERWTELFGEEYIDDFATRRKNAFLKARLLIPKTEKTFKKREKDNGEFRQTKFLQEGIETNTGIFIYGNKVALVSLNSYQPMGIVIDDVSIRNIMSQFFELLWLNSQ